MITNEELLEFAKNASQNAYAPFSNFKVGASVLFESGKHYEGCNVENSSYGLSLCAERNAISTAVASGETTGMLKIAIYSPNIKMCVPCGACRQWGVEFQKGSEARVVLEGENSEAVEVMLNELIPLGFKL